MSIQNVILSVLTDNAFLGAIFSTIFIILIGYYLRKSNKVKDDASKVLTTILLSVSLPALAFNAFMTDISDSVFTTGLNTLVFGFVAYILLIILTYVYKAKYKGDMLDAIRGITIFGSTTFFGIPIISAFFGQEGTLYANLFNIAYRVFLYSYGLILFSGMKFEKKSLKTIFLNPIVIATFLGLVIWVFQKQLPQVTIGTGDTAWTGAFLRLDKTMPWFTKMLSYLASLSSPLAWLAIGMTLAKISLKEAAKNANTWIYAFGKFIVMPGVFVVLMILMQKFNVLPINAVAISAITIMLSTPPATVAVSYAINYDKESVFASNASLLATVLAVVAIIVWIVILSALTSLGIIV